MQAKQSLRFSRKDPKQFFKTLNQRVNLYFKEKNVPKTGNWKLYVKTVIMFSLMVAPYILVIALDISLWLKLPLCMLMGIGIGIKKGFIISIYILARCLVVFEFSVKGETLFSLSNTRIHTSIPSCLASFRV